MEDCALDLVIGKGPSGPDAPPRSAQFTIIGATTRVAMLSSPLRDRFGVTYRLDFYDAGRHRDHRPPLGRILNVSLDDGGTREIASRARGTPRVANRLLKRVRDFAQVRAAGAISEQVAQEALAMLDVDSLGLDEIDRRVLAAIIDKFDGGPVGLDTIAACVAEEADTIMDVYEPYLIQLGFLARTPRGRTATRRAYDHLGRQSLWREAAAGQPAPSLGRGGCTASGPA